MKIEYLSPEKMNELWSSGKTVKMYEPPYSDMPRNFASKERRLFAKLEKAASSSFGGENIYISYDTWADLAIRMYADVTIFDKNLVLLLMNFVQVNCPDHYLSCTILDLITDEWTIYGSFGFNGERLLIDEKLKNLWLERVGKHLEQPGWEVNL